MAGRRQGAESPHRPCLGCRGPWGLGTIKNLESLSLIIPAYNEEKRLPSTLDRIEAFFAGPQWPAEKGLALGEIVVVNDGSKDATATLVRERMAQNPLLRLVENPGNRGKGYAVRHGMQQMRCDWALLTDADLSAPIEELAALWGAVKEKRAEIAIGSRALDRSKVTVHQPWARELSGRIFNVVMRTATGLPFLDTQCGFKLFSRRAAEIVFSRQQLERFGFDVEILYIAKLHGLPIAEVPVAWANVEGTTVSLLSGADGFADIWRVRRNHAAGKYR